jgi:enoyl-CoA hydratase
MAHALDRIVTDMEASPTIACWVLCSEPNESNVFCAGADLNDVAAGKAGELMNQWGLAGLTHRRREKPLIAAVEGLATAGGCELVLSCDLLVASANASFGLAEVTRNLLASAGGVYRLPRALGRRVGLEAILTGEPVGAQRAFDLGLVNRLTEPGGARAEALVLAHQIAAGPPLATRAALRVVQCSEDLDESELDQMARSESAKLRGSEDTKEAIAAFLEKRAPRWQGR